MNDYVCMYTSESISANVHSYMLDSMVSVIQYGENIPPGILDVLLINITESHKVTQFVSIIYDYVYFSVIWSSQL